MLDVDVEDKGRVTAPACSSRSARRRDRRRRRGRGLGRSRLRCGDRRRQCVDSPAPPLRSLCFLCCVRRRGRDSRQVRIRRWRCLRRGWWRRLRRRLRAGQRDCRLSATDAEVDVGDGIGCHRLRGSCHVPAAQVEVVGGLRGRCYSALNSVNGRYRDGYSRRRGVSRRGRRRRARRGKHWCTCATIHRGNWRRDVCRLWDSGAIKSSVECSRRVPLTNVDVNDDRLRHRLRCGDGVSHRLCGRNRFSSRLCGCRGTATAVNWSGDHRRGCRPSNRINWPRGVRGLRSNRATNNSDGCCGCRRRRC
jgi:hypothetical protein